MLEHISSAIDRHASAIRSSAASLIAAINRQETAIATLERTLRRAMLGVPSPITGFSLRLVQELKEPNMPTFNLYEASIPEASGPNSADVTAGCILVQLDGGEVTHVHTPKGPATFSNLKLEQGKTARIGFVHVDDAGNHSSNPLYLPDFPVSDTVPPPDATEGFGLTPTGEITE